MLDGSSKYTTQHKHADTYNTYSEKGLELQRNRVSYAEENASTYLFLIAEWSLPKRLPSPTVEPVRNAIIGLELLQYLPSQSCRVLAGIELCTVTE